MALISSDVVGMLRSQNKGQLQNCRTAPSCRILGRRQTKAVSSKVAWPTGTPHRTKCAVLARSLCCFASGCSLMPLTAWSPVCTTPRQAQAQLVVRLLLVATLLSTGKEVPQGLDAPADLTWSVREQKSTGWTVVRLVDRSNFVPWRTDPMVMEFDALQREQPNLKWLHAYLTAFFSDQLPLCKNCARKRSADILGIISAHIVLLTGCSPSVFGLY